MMTVDPELVPDPRRGWSASALIKALTPPVVLKEADEALALWVRRGRDPAELFMSEDIAVPREWSQAGSDRDFSHHPDRDMWFAAVEALRLIEEVLADAINGGGFEAWLYEVSSETVREATSELTTSSPLAASNEKSEPESHRSTAQWATRRALAKGQYTGRKLEALSDLKTRNAIPSMFLLRAHVLGGRRALDGEGWLPPAAPACVLAFYPLIELPDFPERLAGMTLPSAFRQFVLRDPLVVTALRRANEASGAPAHVAEGWFTPRDRFWPVDFRPADLAARWIEETENRFVDDRRERREADDEPPPPIVVEASKLLLARLRQLLGALRDGRITATGRLVGHPEPACISASLWDRPSTRIDFINGEIRHSDIALIEDSDTTASNPTRVWTDLQLVAEAMSILEFDERRQPGNKTKIDYESAFAYIITDWIDGRLKNPPESVTEIYERLKTIAKEKNDETIASRKTFGEWLRNSHPALYSALTEPRKPVASKAADTSRPPSKPTGRK